MLNGHRHAATDGFSFEKLRATEFPHLDRDGLAYLDYTGAALPAASQLRAHAEMVQRAVLGNPHSENGPSRASGDLIERTKHLVLEFFNADARVYDVCFTANTSAACKLVAESFPFRRGSVCLLSADNHNSINGIVEYARRRGATIATMPLTSELRLRGPAAHLDAHAVVAPSLFAFPAQSNFSGVRHPLALIAAAQQRGFRVLVDAAAYVPSSPLDLRNVTPDFVVLSFYKMFGFPTGVGALIARRDALRELERPWFAGGTVEWASVQHRAHRLRASIAGFEDGTPNYYGIAALEPGLALLRSITMPRVSKHVENLVAAARRQMLSTRHNNGSPVFRVYGPRDGRDQGGTIAVNALGEDGRVMSYDDIEREARDRRIAVRGGCFCNPGASERAFAFRPRATARCFRRTARREFSPQLLGECLGGAYPVGAIRLSVGIATNDADVARCLSAIASIATNPARCRAAEAPSERTQVAL